MIGFMLAEEVSVDVFWTPRMAHPAAEGIRRMLFCTLLIGVEVVFFCGLEMLYSWCRGSATVSY